MPPQATRKHSIVPYIFSMTTPEHISNTESDFVSIRSINPDTVKLCASDGSRITAIGRGDINLKLANGKELVLKDALYVPTIATPLVSFSKLSKSIPSLSLQSSIEGSRVFSNGQLIATASEHPKYGLPAIDLENAVEIPLPDPNAPLMMYNFSVFPAE